MPLPRQGHRPSEPPAQEGIFIIHPSRGVPAAPEPGRCSLGLRPGETSITLPG